MISYNLFEHNFTIIRGKKKGRDLVLSLLEREAISTHLFMFLHTIQKQLVQLYKLVI